MGERGSFYRLGSAEREKDSIVHSSGRARIRRKDE